MSSPGASSDLDESKKGEQITFRFCSECSNMLYPKEDPDTHQLRFSCRTCTFSEPAQSSCVFRNKFRNDTAEVAGVTTDIGADPTLPRSNKKCPINGCGNEDAVFFQSQQRTADSKMKLFYVCAKCGHVFH
ncbi:hypothetical protein BJ878DRAFT_512341 [Calycina marina]|uniref:DNA-directed RNA polymerase subunit n=1 Tax=Calycina marina TaxID=1763456 RepID=A0A9P7Z0N8_9HELO|nr:hypothetical protein BJ878DRAFT_512341 [Calycina marina]